MSNLKYLLIAACLNAIFNSARSDTIDGATTDNACDLQTCVTVEIREGIPDQRSWDLERPDVEESFTEPAFGIVSVPKKFNGKGLVIDRDAPYLLVAKSAVQLPDGNCRLLLRSRNAARLWIDGKLITETAFTVPNTASHEKLPQVDRFIELGIHALPVGHQERLVQHTFEQGTHEIQLEAVVGGKGLRTELGELMVAFAAEGEPFHVLAPGEMPAMSKSAWSAYATTVRERRRKLDDVAREKAGHEELEYWQKRHDMAREYINQQPAITPPPVVADTIVQNDVDRFVVHQSERAQTRRAPLADDYSFLRRVFLDTVGVVPTQAEIDEFFDDLPRRRRENVIDRLLSDGRWADHWVGYWQDVLAENPALLKPQLNNTGPFRWWIHQSFLDNKPFDRFATELVMMEGSIYQGAPAGFSMATMNDAPMAAKAHVLAKAFLAVEMQCARCHDAPFHPWGQEQLFQFGAMLKRSPLEVPASSTVDLANRTRTPAIEISLKAGADVEPHWPFDEMEAELLPGLLRHEEDSRERLAAMLTSPANGRFAKVAANRLWHRYMGRGIIEPVDDWNSANTTQSDLLDYLARELVGNGYDLKHVVRLILNSHAYQQVIGSGGEDAGVASPARRRLTAEQLVDTLFHVTGKSMQSELLCLDPEARRPVQQFVNLGQPERAWQFTSLSNDRDRPSLALPYAQNIVDLLIVMGWRESRQSPITERDQTPTVLQPMVLANGVIGRRMATLSDDSHFTGLALRDLPLDELVEATFLRLLTRPPNSEEAAMFRELLQPGFDGRRILDAPVHQPAEIPITGVSWANHFDAESVRIKIELAEIARAGDTPTARLDADWRERMEDMVWTLIQSPEFIYIP